MTGDEALEIHVQAQDLLARQATALGVDSADLALAEQLGAEITTLLGSVPAPELLTGLDDALRARLLACACQTAVALHACTVSLAHLRHQRLGAQARSERDDAALRHYLPAADGGPARFLDERR